MGKTNVLEKDSVMACSPCDTDGLDLSVFFILDTSLSLLGQRISALYSIMSELIESLEDYGSRCDRRIAGDILLMGTGDKGDDCQWLMGRLSDFSEIHDRLDGEFPATGHTVLLKALEVTGSYISMDNLDPSKVVIVVITDGEFGFITPEEVKAVISGVAERCNRMVLLVGQAYDEDVVAVTASSGDYVFRNANHYALLNRLLDIVEREDRR